MNDHSTITADAFANALKGKGSATYHGGQHIRMPDRTVGLMLVEGPGGIRLALDPQAEDGPLKTMIQERLTSLYAQAPAPALRTAFESVRQLYRRHHRVTPLRLPPVYDFDTPHDPDVSPCQTYDYATAFRAFTGGPKVKWGQKTGFNNECIEIDLGNAHLLISRRHTKDGPYHEAFVLPGTRDAAQTIAEAFVERFIERHATECETLGGLSTGSVRDLIYGLNQALNHRQQPASERKQSAVGR